MHVYFFFTASTEWWYDSEVYWFLLREFEEVKPLKDHDGLKNAVVLKCLIVFEPLMYSHSLKTHVNQSFSAFCGITYVLLFVSHFIYTLWGSFAIFVFCCTFDIYVGSFFVYSVRRWFSPVIALFAFVDHNIVLWQKSVLFQCPLLWFNNFFIYVLNFFWTHQHK